MTLDYITRVDVTASALSLTPQMYGAIGDGTGRALSTIYGTLAAAQAVYPFVTALTQQLDWAGIQKMSYEALGYPTFEHADTSAKLNKAMYIPAGAYQLGADPWLIRNASGVSIRGAGRRATKIVGSSVVFATDGIWYSKIDGVDFETTGAAITVADIDGNVTGHPYATRGVQGNTFTDCRFNGATLATYAFSLTRIGNDTGGGAQGSENLFLNCHFDGSTTANFFSTGFNALNNTFIGGNCATHQKHGLYITGGSIYVFSMGFQSTYAYTQLVNDGYDINANTTGVDDRITIIGCRTESLRFYRGAASQPPVLIGNKQSYAGDVGWTASTAYTSNQTNVKLSATLGYKLYRVTTAGTSGGTQPTWPDSGTVTDNSVVWTMTDFDVIQVASAQLISNGMQVGFTSQTSMTDAPTQEITADYKATMSDELILCNNTTDITVTLPTFSGTGSVRQKGKRYIIKKVLTNANTVTVVSSDGGNLDGAGGAVVIPGGSMGFITAEMGAGGGISARHWIISKSLDPDPQIRRLLANQGTTLVAGDFALSGGFGTTASVAIVNASKDARGTITITSTGTGQGADPTVTLTFKDGAFYATPFAVVCRSGGSQPLVPFSISSVSTTTLALKFHGTPVAAETFTLTFFVEG